MESTIVQSRHARSQFASVVMHNCLSLLALTRTLLRSCESVQRLLQTTIKMNETMIATTDNDNTPLIFPRHSFLTWASACINDERSVCGIAGERSQNDGPLNSSYYFRKKKNDRIFGPAEDRRRSILLDLRVVFKPSVPA
jgi:hypothetical protein